MFVMTIYLNININKDIYNIHMNFIGNNACRVSTDTPDAVARQ